MNARFQNGLRFRPAATPGSGHRLLRIRAKLPEQTGGFSTAAKCRVRPVNPVLPPRRDRDARATAGSSIPKIDVLLSGAFLSSPGVPLAANYAVPAAVVAQALGRPPSGNVTNLTINLLAPGEARGERVNQLDWRIGKILRFGRQRATISVDLFNALNSDAILAYNQAFIPGGSWLMPTSVLTARTTKLTFQWDF